MVEAVLRLIRTTLQAPERFDYCVLASGSDYPIRPIEELEAFLTARLLHAIIGNWPFAARVRRNLVFTDWRGPATIRPRLVSTKRSAS